MAKSIRVEKKYPKDLSLPILNEQKEDSFLSESPGGAIAFTSGYVGHGKGDDLVSFLIDLADIQDEEENIAEANFIDFIIKKASEINNKNYFKEIKSLIKKTYLEGGNDALPELGRELYHNYMFYY